MQAVPINSSPSTPKKEVTPWLHFPSEILQPLPRAIRIKFSLPGQGSWCFWLGPGWTPCTFSAVRLLCMYQYKVAFPASAVPLDQTPFLSFFIFPMCKPNHFPHVKICPASCFLRDKTKTSVWYGGFAYIRVPAYFSNQSSSYAHIFDITFRHIQLLRVPEAQHERKFSPNHGIYFQCQLLKSGPWISFILHPFLELQFFSHDWLHSFSRRTKSVLRTVPGNRVLSKYSWMGSPLTSPHSLRKPQ